MPAPVDPEKFEVTYGMGVRESVLVGIAAIQAIWLVFLVERLPFIVRLCLALFVAAVLLVFALIPYKDKPIEYSIAKWLRYRLGSQGRVYRTASREITAEMGLASPVEPASKPVSAAQALPLPTPARAKPKRAQPRRERPVHVKPAKTPRQQRRHGRWMQPDPGLVMAVFLGVLVMGSVLAYVGKGGFIKPEAAWAETTQWFDRAVGQARSPWH